MALDVDVAQGVAKGIAAYNVVLAAYGEATVGLEAVVANDVVLAAYGEPRREACALALPLPLVLVSHVPDDVLDAVRVAGILEIPRGAVRRRRAGLSAAHDGHAWGRGDGGEEGASVVRAWRAWFGEGTRHARLWEQSWAHPAGGR